MPIILLMLPICGFSACTGGSGRQCVVSSECEPGLVCAMGSCVPMSHNPDVEAGDGELADQGPDPDGEAEGTPREEALETGPEATDLPSETDAPHDVPSEEGPPAAGIVGDPCTAPEDCTGVPVDTRQCLTDLATITFVGGYCSAECTADGDCGDSSAACADMTVIKYCLRLCAAPADCRIEENYTCAMLPSDPSGSSYCIPNRGG